MEKDEILEFIGKIRDKAITKLSDTMTPAYPKYYDRVFKELMSDVDNQDIAKLFKRYSEDCSEQSRDDELEKYMKMCKQSIDAFTVSNKSMSKAILAQGDYLDSIQTEAPDGIHIDYQKIISSMLSFQGQLLEELRRSDGHIRKLETDLEQALGESRYDPLTKLLNKKAFMSDVDSILQKASTQKSDLSVAYIKIGKFQDISAKLGYLAGDKVLIFLSNTLKSILANDKRIYRVGEDEILVLIDDTFNEKPLEIAKKIISKIELSKLVYSEQPLKINVAIGMAKFNHDDDYISLIERASKALAMAKEAGGNFVKEFII